jgi:hypothetical protein
MAAILVVERADDLVVHIGDREGGLKRSSRRHGADRSCMGGGGAVVATTASSSAVAAAATAEVKRTGATHTELAGEYPGTGTGTSRGR